MFMFNDKTYNFLKRFVQVILPAIGTLYYSLASTWGLPNPDAVVATTSAFALFLGICLGISNSQYEKNGYEGTMLVTPTDDKTIVSMDIDESFDPEKLSHLNSIRFKVKNVPLEQQNAAPIPPGLNDDDHDFPEGIR